jgi:OmcA/MtrC family decaheme c-type cytochrome
MESNSTWFPGHLREKGVQKMKYELWRILSALFIASLLAVGGCDDGDDGAPGPAGPAGADGPAGPAGPAGEDVDPTTVDNLQAQIDALAIGEINPESCAVCHSDVGVASHQADYDDYNDPSELELTITGVTSVADGAAFDATMTFTITKNGAPYADADGLPSLSQKRFYAVMYDAATRTYENSKSFGTFTATATPGTFTALANDIAYAPELSNAQIYGYIADGDLDVEQGGSHVHLYADVSNTSLAFGTAMATDPSAYVSTANASGCEKCHGTPYMKHGYRAAEVEGIPDFAACKVCHYDSRDGGHEDWQILVEDPARFVEVHDGADLTPEEEAFYAYKANVMNDTHMSHAMEFPYPQSMITCNTCHEGKLDRILTDDNFEVETCRSCHPVSGPAEGTDPHRAPALETLWEAANAGFHSINSDCNASCHTASSSVGPVFSDLHTGYNERIYADTAGTRVADLVTVTIDDASVTDNIMNIKFSATAAGALPGGLTVSDILPTIMVGLYGWDTHNFIVGAHERDADRNRLGELPIDGVTTNPRFEVVAASGGMWEVNFDMSLWADQIAADEIKRAEIAVMPDLRVIVGERDSRSNGESDDTTYAVNAPSSTFDLATNAFDAYFNPIVDVAGCNACHDALATTFHSPNRGGNVVVCRMCHITRAGGSHLEMQSRSIDSYVHAVHSFQAFDIDEVDFADPVDATMYELHINHTYPNFTIKNCESCHNEGTYNVPDQSMSLPGLLSDSETITGADRNIGYVPEYVSGPASRACGGCHRADLINADDAGGLAAFNAHAKTFGYLPENDDDDLVLSVVIDEIMSMFE